MKRLFTALAVCVSSFSGESSFPIIEEPHEWRTFAVGEPLGDKRTENDGTTRYWRSIPPHLALFQHSYLSVDSKKKSTVDYGKIDFSVVNDGKLMMLTTTRFGEGGNSSGNWLPEVSLRVALESGGWRFLTNGIRSEYGTAQAGKNIYFHDWLLFERDCRAGEKFSIRTEKYHAPVLLRRQPLTAKRSPASIFHLQWYSETGSIYRIEHSKDFKSWVPVVETIAATELVTFSPVLPEGAEMNFYRFFKK